MELFSVKCLTCSAQLKVRDAAAIGAILECPKCGSMVEVKAPPGWKPPSVAPATKSPAIKSPPFGERGGDDAANAAEGTAIRGARTGEPGGETPPKVSDSSLASIAAAGLDLSAAEKLAAQRGSRDPAAADKAAAAKGTKSVSAATSETQAVSKSSHGRPRPASMAGEPGGETPMPGRAAITAASVAGAGSALAANPAAASSVAPPEAASASAASGAPTPTAPLPTASSSTAPSLATVSANPAASAPELAEALADPLSPSLAASAAAMGIRKWLLIGSGVLTACAIGAAIWSSFAGRRPKPPVSTTWVASQPAAPADTPAPPQPAVESPQAEPVLLDVHWLPRETRAVLSLRLAEGNFAPPDAWPEALARPWNESLGQLLGGLKLSAAKVKRLTWAALDARHPPADGVLIVELLQPLGADDEAALLAETELGELALGGATCRTKTNGPWRRPFALIDGQTIVTGPAGLLTELAKRPPPDRGSVCQSEPLTKMLAATDVRGRLTLLADLVAARQAGIEIPAAWVQAWPAGLPPLRLLFTLPEGASLSLDGPPLGMRLELWCPSETAAGEVRAAADELARLAQSELSSRLDGLPLRLQAGELSVAAASRQRLLVEAGLAALQERQSGIVGARVWMTTSGRPSGDLLRLAEAAAASVPQWEHRRLADARIHDEANHALHARSLIGFNRAEGSLPAGASGSSVLPPQQRLSWIATLLPHYGHLDWVEQLKPEKFWDDPANTPITRQLLPQVINPALGVERTASGFPVTHYVGVAGVGADAGGLDAGHPRAGLFGYDRRTRLESLSDGASNTLAILGVSAKTGAWASGGSATVRGLTQEPYVNGPDGFGSGQPDGMFAAMADGSVRFLQKDIDPAVVRQLAVVGGPKPKPAGTPAAQAAADGPSPAVRPAAPPVAPRARPAADLAPRLAQRLPAIEFRNVPLADFVNFVSKFIAVPAVIDQEALAEMGVASDAKVNVRLSDAPLAEALTFALAEHALAYEVSGEELRITSSKKLQQTVTTQRYDVADLVGKDPQRVTALADFVKPFAEAAGAQPGAAGKLSVEGTALVIEQSAAGQALVDELLQKLRIARGLPLVGRPDASRLALTSRRGRAEQTLARPVSGSFAAGTRLSRIVDHLQDVSGVNIVLDVAALRADGGTSELEASLRAANEPLDAVLARLAASLDLSVRVIDARIVQLTTRKEAARLLELEVYRVADLVNAQQAGPLLAERIRTAIAPESWAESKGPGLVRYDELGKCLVVLHVQDVQFKVEDLIDSWRGQAGGKVNQ
jgi:hypothetical protein